MNEVIINILNLPRNRRLTQKSIRELLHGSGISEYLENFDEEDIRSYLEEHPDYISEWWQWSEDKRTRGWYIIANDDITYSVAYLTVTSKVINERIFCDMIEAISFFIRQEVKEYVKGSVGRAI